MKFTADYPPSANRYWRHVGTKVLLSADARAYRTRTAGMALSAGIRPTKAPVALTLHVYRPRQIGDLDNALKVLIDSLRGVAYEDDKQVVKIVAERFEDKARPRVEVEIEEVEI